ncbi:MAG: homoserine kinase [Okeania sp. SIO2G4]|uniref:homoserine kinase n=1 Tax=unclassified Okeania TaxID=2634635 RepID=UPI0013B64B24|nr:MULTISPECIES: homoserine kinase [unclassified Okeania]NEP06074.1 homoserine kinase [Okeania sp. SIO4D6]NEP45168.1 homoserine kinase [Okeania sp. SIO2H7]NEP72728.1 homoserine kinase [Okeania sp. SIO2G5]NEP93362.1 homoserine kinase [Okeania sp. SIO2F5]NEQ91374.1 homoserine kinase [Okeania sp. SIO2G4]
MTTPSSVTVTVPATTANIGPGFDCIGAALSLYNRLKFSIADSATELKISVTGKEAARVSTDNTNLAYQAFVKLYEHLDQIPPSVEIEIDLGVPLARGLGSSATAIVGGLLGANQLAGHPLSQTEVMNLAVVIEGHPDNVVPALLGGCCLTASTPTGWEICDIPWHSDIVPVVAIPDFELSTAEARRVLPTEYCRADAIFNAAHLGILLRGLETGNGDWLKAGMQDKIHQPYRKSLITGYEKVRLAALDAGADEMVISGAGPTLLALTNSLTTSAVVTAMADTWKNQGVVTEVKALEVDTRGAICN